MAPILGIMLDRVMMRVIEEQKTLGVHRDNGGAGKMCPHTLNREVMEVMKALEVVGSWTDDEEKGG